MQRGVFVWVLDVLVGLDGWFLSKEDESRMVRFV